jgi:hypothetical protein
MADPPTYTVKLTSKQSARLVVNLMTKKIRDDVIACIDTMGGKLIADWYWFDDIDDAWNVIKKAKHLDSGEETFFIPIGSG